MVGVHPTAASGEQVRDQSSGEQPSQAMWPVGMTEPVPLCQGDRVLHHRPGRVGIRVPAQTAWGRDVECVSDGVLGQVQRLPLNIQRLMGVGYPGDDTGLGR